MKSTLYILFFAPYDMTKKMFSVQMLTIYPRRGVITRPTLPQLVVGAVAEAEGTKLRFEYQYYLTWMNWVRGYPWAFVPVLRCEDLVEEFGIIRGTGLCRRLGLRK